MNQSWKHIATGTRRRLSGVLTLLCLLPGVRGLMAQADNETIVFPDSARQVIRGFGAANILPWRPDMTADQADKAFGTGDGQIGFSILRLRVPSVSTRQEFTPQLATARLAQSYGAIVIASPWSPPAGMKTNNNLVGGELEESAYPDFADHLNTFADFMADNGAPLYAISVQNEPDIAVTYESCDWNASQMLKFVKEQGASIGTRLIVPESFNFNKTISNVILNDADAAAHVDIIGGHLYGGGLEAYPLAERMGKELWMTEYLNTDTTWNAVLSTGRQMHDCMNAGMNAYIWWYIVRYYGPIHENGNVTKRGYVMSQYARFIRPGFLRVRTASGRGPALSITAYKGGSRLVLVVVNTRTTEITRTFRVDGAPARTAVFTPYVTSDTRNCSQEGGLTATDGVFTATLAPSSVTTFVADILSGVDGSSVLPGELRLHPNFPNPFNPRTVVAIELPRACDVSLKVVNLLGVEVATLLDGRRGAGRHDLAFDASGLASGTYVLRLEADGAVRTRKMTLLR